MLAERLQPTPFSRALASLDGGHDPRRLEPGEPTSIGNRVIGGGFEGVEAGFISRDERRPDVADRYALP
jgi:hypothetical protein